MVGIVESRGISFESHIWTGGVKAGVVEGWGFEMVLVEADTDGISSWDGYALGIGISKNEGVFGVRSASWDEAACARGAFRGQGRSGMRRLWEGECPEGKSSLCVMNEGKSWGRCEAIL